MMVCSLGNGRMAAMARLLEAGSYSQNIAEEVGNQKFAAQYIQRELREADEANLLDEKDMHVFGLEPMTDSLHLVCCNACKKPIMASQYATHAELCKSLSYAEEIVSELDGGTGNKKPPRKERKKLTAYSAKTGGGKERFESAEADDVATSEFHLDEQVQLSSSFSMETKRNLSCLDGALTMDVSRVSPESTDHSTCAMRPPAKRSKLIAAEGLPMSDHLETANGVARSLCICTQKACTCKEFPKGCRSEKTFDYVNGYQKPSDVRECCFPSKDVPAPLATKMFYSQRNHRLRSALTYLYYEASSKEHSGDFVNSKALQGNAVPLQVSSPKNFSHGKINVQREKREKHSMPSVQKPDQILADSSEIYLDKLGGRTPAVNFSNDVPVNNGLRTQAAPVGIVRSIYLSKPFPFAGNSGTQLGNMQQPKGSVPVT
ncbi:SCA7 domain-containing protein [Actinidia chinensis var. chinensis]|uniref:SCA7 domain-containing protein n=1 Tax=Actinidia chinensis var. chinensis TaxID=1590841 RepID=A0A2R6PJZ8_ACTCC|nr:SCA7 domain-containing protein [Actinidia chinensis var. chinensis]